ncbi:CCD78 protein, partial [Ramphastos sulfuratus]|nr:CCD78 protein [Ramphastos sulfuratus]
LVMEKELQEAKAATGNSQQKLVEQSAVLLSCRSQLQEVEAENSRLQLRLKELSEDYRCRLVQYLRDLAAYVDSKAPGPIRAPADGAAMKSIVDSMLQDIRASYRAREEQLARAARGYQKRMKTLVKKHENLLIAYGLQREQIRASGSSTMDCGPAELHFSITDPELLTNTARELQRLREQKAKLELQLQEVQQPLAVTCWAGPEGLGTTRICLSSPRLLTEKGWAELRKQLQEFTHHTQEGLEQERSQLLARALVAEERVSELQEYIDQHLAR